MWGVSERLSKRLPLLELVLVAWPVCGLVGRRPSLGKTLRAATTTTATATKGQKANVCEKRAPASLSLTHTHTRRVRMSEVHGDEDFIISSAGHAGSFRAIPSEENVTDKAMRMVADGKSTVQKMSARANERREGSLPFFQGTHFSPFSSSGWEGRDLKKSVLCCVTASQASRLSLSLCCPPIHPTYVSVAWERGHQTAFWHLVLIRCNWPTANLPLALVDTKTIIAKRRLRRRRQQEVARAAFFQGLQRCE